jgi:hypothetical protein
VELIKWSIGKECGIHLEVNEKAGPVIGPAFFLY